MPERWRPWQYFRLLPRSAGSACERPSARQAEASLVYCGDDESGKGVAAELIRDMGFDPVDAGPLRIARYTEPFSLLVAQLAYEGKGGPELAYRFERFREQVEGEAKAAGIRPKEPLRKVILDGGIVGLLGVTSKPVRLPVQKTRAGCDDPNRVWDGSHAGRGEQRSREARSS